MREDAILKYDQARSKQRTVFRAVTLRFLHILIYFLVDAKPKTQATAREKRFESPCHTVTCSQRTV
jgi:hypothetical protein